MIDGTTEVSWRGLDEKLRPFVARRVASDEVDDVVQEVFVRLLTGIGGLRQRDRLGPWVYQVARSAIGDHHRRVARRPEVPVESAELGASSEAGFAGVASEDAEPTGDAEQVLVAAIEPFVRALPEHYREALELTELGGLTQREAAERLGISLSGMKSRVQRGRRMLREALEDCCAIALDARGHVVGCEVRDGDACACQPTG